MNRLSALFLFASLLFGQIEIIPEGEAAMSHAFLMERAGNIDGAKEIYLKTLSGNPNHQRAYLQLKSIYLKRSNYNAAVELIQSWLKTHPRDLPGILELGESYYHQGKHEEALSVWSKFESEHLSNTTTYRMLFHTYSRFGLTVEMDQITQKGRTVFSKPDFLALALGNYYQSRQTYERALKEYMLLTEAHPGQLQFVLDRILSMSDQEEAVPVIDRFLNQSFQNNLKTKHILLSGFYYKTGQFHRAYEQHTFLGVKTVADENRWLTFARNLRKEKQFSLAINAYHSLLEKLNTAHLQSTDIIGQALLGLGQIYEDQIILNNRQLQFISFFPGNIFFENHFYGKPDISTESLASTLEHYQSILALLPASQSTAMVHYRLGEIQYRITRNFTGARTSYETAAKTHPKPSLDQLIQLRLGDLYCAEGNLEAASSYFLELSKSTKKSDPVNEISLRYLQSLFLNSHIQTARTSLDSLLQTLLPTHRFFNDLIELQELIGNHYSEGSAMDKAAFLFFVKAERFIRQNKLSEGEELLVSLKKTYPEASILPIAMIRLALIQLQTGNTESALETAALLQSTHYKDKGLILTGEITEKFLQNTRDALPYYHQLIAEFPNSLLAEPIRYHIRKLSNDRESQ